MTFHLFCFGDILNAEERLSFYGRVGKGAFHNSYKNLNENFGQQEKDSLFFKSLGLSEEKKESDILCDACMCTQTSYCTM